MASVTSRDHVLILDFESRIAGAVRDMLSQSGYRIAAPRTPEEASGYFEGNAGEIAFVIAHTDYADTALLLQIMRPELRVFVFHETGTAARAPRAPCPRFSSLRSFP